MINNDGQVAFDRVLPALSIVTCRRLGLPDTTAKFIFKLLWNMEFQVGTGLGISASSYGANDDPSNPGQGSGQGMGSRPMLHGASSDITLSIYRHNASGANFQHPSGTEPPRTDYITQYMDDVTQFLNKSGLQDH